MNLRDIKKDIEYVIGAFIDDCSLFSSVNKNADDEVLGGLFDEAVNLYNDLKDRVNAVPAGLKKGKRNSYFNAIRKDLLEGAETLYAKLSDTIKQTEK